MEEQKHKWFINRRNAIILSLLIGVTLFYLNLFREQSLLDIGILVVIFLIAGFLKIRKKYKEPHFTFTKVIVIIFVSSYLASAIIRFSLISNNIRELYGVVSYTSYMSDDEQKRLGILFPESTKFRYYFEGINWLEQDAKLIAVVDQEDLPQITKSFNMFFTGMPKSKFWYIHYVFNKRKQIYSYGKFIDLPNKRGGAVTADVLVVFQRDNKAKLYMDIIYW